MPPTQRRAGVGSTSCASATGEYTTIPTTIGFPGNVSESQIACDHSGEWSEVLDLSTWPLEGSEEKRSQRELGRAHTSTLISVSCCFCSSRDFSDRLFAMAGLSPALDRPLVVSRLRPADWQPQRTGDIDIDDDIDMDEDEDGGCVSVIYTTRNGALHELIRLGKRGREIRREITAPHSHPGLFSGDGASGGTLGAARAVGVDSAAAGSADGGAHVGSDAAGGLGLLYAVRASDNRLLSF